MVGNIIENNMVTISGKIVSEAVFSHEVYGEGFYCFTLEVPRLSECTDKINVTVSERLISKESLQIGKLIEVEGQFRSYNNYDNPEGSKLILTVFAREIRFLEDDKKIKNPNQIFLNGFICKSRYTEQLLLEGKLRIYCWLSTDRTINRTTYRVFAGEEMPDIQPDLRSAKT